MTRWTVKPAACSVRSRNASAPPSAGVTDGQRTRSRVRATGSARPGMTAWWVCMLIPQQLVDAGLCARLLVDALDDHRAVERRPAVLAGQRAGHHDRVSRHFALQHLAAVAVDNHGRGAD